MKSVNQSARRSSRPRAIVDGNQRLVPEAEVCLEREGLSLQVDAPGGSFEVQVEPGKWACYARSPGHAEAKARIDIPAGEVEQCLLELGTGRTLEGRVLALETDQPLPGARVLEIGPRLPRRVTSALSDADGRFSLAGLGDVARLAFGVESHAGTAQALFQGGKWRPTVFRIPRTKTDSLRFEEPGGSPFASGVVAGLFGQVDLSLPVRESPHRVAKVYLG